MTRSYAAYPDAVSVEHIAGERLELGQVCSRCGTVLERGDLEVGTRVRCKAGVWAAPGAEPLPGVVIVPCFPQRPPGVT